MKLPVWVTRNWRLKVGCALLAFVTWMGVVYAGNPPETRSVTVHIPQEAASIPAGFVLVRKVPDVVIRLGGSRSSLDGFNTSTLTVLVNWKAVTHAGVQYVPINITDYDPSVELIDPPSRVQADLDALESVSLPITIVVTSPPPAGYVTVAEATSPDKVVVAGPHNQLKALEARVTVDLSNQKANFVADDQLVLIYDSRGNRLNDVGITPSRVRVSISIAANLTSRVAAVVPKVLGSVASGHQLVSVSVNPLTVVLSGPQDLLNALDSVSTSAISLGGITGTINVTVNITPPAGVTASPSTVVVTITITALPTPAPSPTPTPTP